MNVVLWVVQVLLALHTVMGAVWKFSNSEQSVPSLSALPHGVWLGLAGFELLCSAGLVLAAGVDGTGALVPAAAVGITAEMLLFCGVHLASGDPDRKPMVYWAVVAAVGIGLACGRLALHPL